jgi:hypothetical protein
MMDHDGATSGPDDHDGGRQAPPPVSLKDPEAYRAFVHALQAKLQPRLAERLDDDVQAEIVNLNRLLLTTHPAALDRYRAQFEIAYEMLGDTPANLPVIRGLRYDLTNALEREARDISRLLLYICGRTPLTAVMSGLLTIFVILTVVTSVVFQGHVLASQSSERAQETYSWLLMLKGVPIQPIMLIVHAAVIGSVASVLTRLSKFLSLTAFNPLLIYFSVLTRPIIAIVFAIFVYTVMKAGVISSLGVDLQGPSAPYFAWAIGFLCGFSERFARDIVTRASAPLGAPEPADQYRPKRTDD